MKTKTKFHGYKTNPRGEREDCVALHIGTYPRRKSLCLYLSEQNKFMAQMTPLAYFRNEEDAKACQRVLDLMILKIETPHE